MTGTFPNLKTDKSFDNDLMDIIRLFSYEKPVEVYCTQENGKFLIIVTVNGTTSCFSESFIETEELAVKRLKKRHCKKHLYDVLKAETGKTFPWGSLTGIRPVRLFNQTAEEFGESEAEHIFKNYYDVSSEKTELVKEIRSVQSPFYFQDPSEIDFYAGIPFCRGRCSYCSFFSADIDKNAGLIDLYTQCLCKDIENAKKIIFENGYKVNSIYVGGGTPSSLPLENLGKILSAISGIKASEYTVEAGRPDSVSRELLQLLKNFNVTRISINPQTVSDKTLETIGRRHTFSQFVEAYNLASEYGFIINTDLIAGLPGETFEDFKKSADTISAMKPHNITIHTLAIKQGSKLKSENFTHAQSTDKMLSYASSKFREGGYRAYYLYRQKNAAGNLENAGFSLPGYECRYNIDNMEDTVSIIACGANSISKRIFEGMRIERLDSPKDISTYCAKNDLLEDKKDFFSKKMF